MLFSVIVHAVIDHKHVFLSHQPRYVLPSQAHFACLAKLPSISWPGDLLTAPTVLTPTQSLTAIALLTQSL